MSTNILVVDDEQSIADLIEVYLKNEGFTIYKFYNGQDALRCVESKQLELAILDVMLPDIDGFTLCQKIRENYNFPVIMLTAKDEEIDKITGLTLGADDYITKPFRPLELVARVKAQLINEFFEITRFNLQTIILNKEKINLLFMLQQMADEFYPMLAPQEKQVSVNVPDGLTLF